MWVSVQAVVEANVEASAASEEEVVEVEVVEVLPLRHLVLIPVPVRLSVFPGGPLLLRLQPDCHRRLIVVSFPSECIKPWLHHLHLLFPGW